MSSSPHLRGSRIVIRIFALLVVIAVGVQLYRFNPVFDPFEDNGVRPESTAVRRVARAPDTTHVKINPGAYRLQIIMLEKALYKLEPEFSDGWAVEVRAKALQEAMSETNRLLNHRDQGLQRAELAVSRLASMVGSEMDAGYQRGPRWPEWRKQWERTRKEFFLNADWYQTYEPMGIPLTSPGGPVSTTDRALVRQLNDFAADVQGAIRRGQDAALKIPEPPSPVQANTPEAQRLEKQWRDWLEPWAREIDELAKRTPGVPAGADAHLVLAGREFGLALASLRSFPAVPAEPVYPTKYTRRKHFEGGRVRVDGARDHLSRIGSPVR